MDKADIFIIGAGVVGLAIARELAMRFPDRDIFLVEQHRHFGQEVSSRNSEVIHAGIYYPTGSLKARLCLEGNRLLYEYCRRYGVRHLSLGKVIVASDGKEIPLLEKVYRQGLENGVELVWLEKREVCRLEPQIHGEAGVLSPHTGIVDTHHLMQCLYRQAVERGVMAVFACPVMAIDQEAGGYRIKAGGEEIKARVVVNSGGLASDRIAALAGMDIDTYRYRLHYCKGEYYRLAAKIQVNHLIYPIPEHSGLGIHLTKDFGGGQRLGPNAYYVDSCDYDMDEKYRHCFYQAARRYLPGLRPGDIRPDYAGIRPKLQGPGEAFRDFVIGEESAKGFPGFINLIGIESPGLTSCLAIGRYVSGIVRELLG